MPELKAYPFLGDVTAQTLLYSEKDNLPHHTNIGEVLEFISAELGGDMTGAQIIDMINAEIGTEWQSGGSGSAETNPTDLGYDGATRFLSSSTGAGVALPLADATIPGLLSSAGFSQLANLPNDLANKQPLGDYALVGHTHSVNALSDSTAAGRALVRAVDAAAQRTLLDVTNQRPPTFGGTYYPNVVAGTGISFAANVGGGVTLNVSTGTATVAAADYGDIIVSSTGVWTVDPLIRASLDKADTAIQAANLGTAAYRPTTDFATAAQGARADTSLQPADVGSAAARSEDYFERRTYTDTAANLAAANPVTVNGRDYFESDTGRFKKGLAPQTYNSLPYAAALPNHTHDNATTTVAGFQSAADKTKLNGIATEATKNQTDAFLLARANHTGVMPPAAIATTGATTGQALVFNGTAYAPGTVSGGTGGAMTGAEISTALQGLADRRAHIDAMQGIAPLGPFVAGDLVQRNAANTAWERVSPGAFTPLTNSWQRYDANGNPITVRDPGTLAILEEAKSTLAVPVPAPVAPAVFSSVAINRLPHHRVVRITFAGANIVLDQAITGVPEGDVILLFVRQDAIGGWTISENHSSIFTWGTDPFGINPAANTESVLVITGRPGDTTRIHNTGFST